MKTTIDISRDGRFVERLKAVVVKKRDDTYDWERLESRTMLSYVLNGI